jgi:phosphoadenosine phosphosulfate reductase
MTFNSNYLNGVDRTSQKRSASQIQFDLNQQIHSEFNSTPTKPELDLAAIDRKLVEMSAENIIRWADSTFGDGLVMSTSFGIQSAVMLHAIVTVNPKMPVIWVDTGYLPEETYRFAEELTKKLDLNLKVYQSPLSPARMEALYGKLWEQNDLDALNLYDKIRKVEPMQRALRELKATAWLAGLRSNQTNYREGMKKIDIQDGLYKILPILDWSSRDIYQYLVERDLPYHPYFDLGYTTVGDWHSSRPLTADDRDERDTRFHGLKQECGIHLPQTIGEAQSLDSSTL